MVFQVLSMLSGRPHSKSFHRRSNAKPITRKVESDHWVYSEPYLSIDP